MRYFLFAVVLLASFGAAGQTIGPGAGGGSGSVTNVPNPTIFGVTCTVATATTTPTITCATSGTLTIGSVNGLTITPTTGTFTLAAAKTLTVSNTLTFTGTDGSTLNIGAGGTLGSAAFVNTGTSGAVLGLLNGNLTFSGNDIFSAGVKLTGLSAGTQVSCLGLDSGNNVVLLASACGAGGGSWNLTDGTTSLTGVTALTVPGGTLKVGGSAGSATLTPIVTQASHAGSFGSWNIGGQDDMSSTGTATLPTFTAGQTAFLTAQSGVTATVGLNSQTVNGLGLNTTLHQFGFYGYTYNSAGVASAFGFPGYVSIATNAIPKYGDASGATASSLITDDGSKVAIAEAALTTPVALTDGATIATNAALSNVFTVTIAGNRTLSNPTNLVAGQFITWQLKEDGTGSRTLALDTAFNLINGGTFAMNSAANAKTTLSCFVDTTSTLQCAGGAPLATVTTGSNCSSAAAPAVCGSASGGSIAVPTGTNPTLTVNTTAVTANSQILMNIDESLGTKLSVTCNTTLTTLTNPVVTARTAGTSFTVQIGATIAVNPACVSYLVVN